jgi:hypothetical protein
MAEARQFLMLIKTGETLKHNPMLVEWIGEIEQDYMHRFGFFGPSVAHLALDGPWDFALVFPGSEESANYLAESIAAKAPGQTEILTLKGTDLDDFRAASAQH